MSDLSVMSLLGKLNSSTEIIPIEGPSEGRKDMKMKKQGLNPYFSDPHIIGRVKQYLDEHNDTSYIDIETMADALQKRYREYGKRKRSAFRGLVEKAFAHILRSYNISPSNQMMTSSEEEFDFGEDEEPDVNRVNERLLSLYMRPDLLKKSMSSKSEDKELINISSDEDENKVVKKEKVQAKIKQHAPITGITLSAVPKPLLSDSQLQTVSNIFKSTEISVSRSAQPLKKNQTSAESKNVRIQKNQSLSTNPQNSHSIDNTRKRKNEEELKAGTPQRRKREFTVHDSQYNFSSLGGIGKVLEEVCKLLVHIQHPEIYKRIGVTPPRGFLLHGPPGCGKTLLAQAIAGELQLPMLKISAPELVGGVSGESEGRIRDLFDQAVSLSPCILFLDEIDAITPHRLTAQREMERRIVAQLLTCLDELNQRDGGSGVLVIGATNRPDSLDPALRRAGRFDREVCLGIPNQEARAEILKVLCTNLRLAPDFNFEEVARNTPGFVGADLMALMREAAMVAVNRVFSELKTKAQIKKDKELVTIDSPTKVVENGKYDLKTKTLIKQDKEVVTIDSPSKATENGKQRKKKTVSVKAKDSDSSSSEVSEKEIGNGVESDKAVDPDSKIHDMVALNASKEGISSPDDNINTKKNLPSADSCQKTSASVTETVIQNVTLSDLVDWLHNQPPLTGEQLSELYIQQSDFKEALRAVQPSAKREGFATVPDVTWDDIGSLKDVREELQLAILGPVQYAKEFADLGLSTPTGVLLCGPPGCGKTLLAKAVANEAGINFISVKGPELLNMYVGESERAVRQCFQRAANSAPCVIFFDELDALCPKRSDAGEGGASMRVVNQMLTEMDGVESRRGVFLLAATNRPDIIDPAVLRPGRLDKIVYVGLPGPQDRTDILRALTKNGTKPRLADNVDLESLGKSDRCHSYTGADLAALVREAAVQSLKEHLKQPDAEGNLAVTAEHFAVALAKIRPSISEKDHKHYEKLRRMYTSVPSSRIKEMESGDDTLKHST
ncbi:nuclear valosin-containing protein-like isoform X1 [Schistocerca gregaria]|uniref:nuclear valosin-containing protein-like isoform X1 n=1 Tax=Schistocerca gregaria TaxID=7010 RepID=UPI00211F3A85|nr:nuclear valosin-containing protein-like isoform X1 [Schistocerca gregaria]